MSSQEDLALIADTGCCSLLGWVAGVALNSLSNPPPQLLRSSSIFYQRLGKAVVQFAQLRMMSLQMWDQGKGYGPFDPKFQHYRPGIGIQFLFTLQKKVSRPGLYTSELRQKQNGQLFPSNFLQWDFSHYLYTNMRCNGCSSGFYIASGGNFVHE